MRSKLRGFTCLLALLLLGLNPVSAAPVDEAFAKLGVPEDRLAAQQTILDHARTFLNPSPESKAWFELVRNARNEAKDPEVQAALAQVLLLDPALPVRSPQGKTQVRNFPAPEGTTPETKLAETERLLDLKAGARKLPLSTDELTEMAKSDDFAVAQRAGRLLRRVAPAAAAPLLWQRLAKTTQRSQIQEIEDELLRLPVGAVAKTAPKEVLGTTPAQQAAWLRIISVRPGIRIDRKLVLPLLKGPANELTEAAWDAVPRLFTLTDKPQIEEAAAGLSPRLAPRAQAALGALR